MKQLHLIFAALMLAVTSFAQVAPITGPSVICAPGPVTMSDATAGGTWTVSAPSILTITTTTGVATGVSAGVATITYTVGASYAVYPVTVYALPASISGPSSVCVGSTIVVTDPSPGGVWSSSSPVSASIGFASGIITGVAAGVSTITYAMPTGCSVTRLVTVDPLPSAISGPSSVCVGAGGTYTVSPSGGAWTISPTTIATMFGGSTITGVSAGTAALTYALPTGCISTTVVTVTSGSSTVYTVTGGGGGFCAGGAGIHVGLSGSSVGCTYQLYDGIAPVGSPVAGTGSALDFGAMTTGGTYTVIADSASTCPTTMTGSTVITVNPLPTAYAVTGGGTYCSGGSGLTIILAGSDVGVSYQLYRGGVPVGTTVPGTGSALSFPSIATAGTYTIVATNVTTGCTNTMSGSATVTVSPSPTVYPVSGGGTYCSGGSGVTIDLYASTAGINYDLMIGGVVVSTMPGTGSTLTFGPVTAGGIYAIQAVDATTGCSDTMSGTATVTVATLIVPTVAISTFPSTTVCSGTTANFSASSTGGGSTPTYAWTVGGVPVGSGPTYSYIPTSGDVIGLTMTSSASCASPTTASTSVTMTVDVPTVTATATATCGGGYTLYASGAMSYSWSPSTGLSCGGCAMPTVIPSATTTYTVSGLDALGCVGRGTVTVDGNRISGYISYSGAVSTDTFKIWLIQFNPIDSSIVATDSTIDCISGGMPYYEFMDKAPGNYLVKAKLNSSVIGTSGYIPTYGLSTPHWDSASTISHSASADSMHINMVYGTVPSGPGFISGYVVSGAGRGTATAVPAVGMLIYLKDVSGHIITYCYTATDGSYSFSHLGYSSYIVYPEAYKYYTTPSAVITLSAAADTSSNINFKQHTSFGTITPIGPLNIQTMSAASTSVLGFYPNPVTSSLHLSWDAGMKGNATVTLTDVTGRTVVNTTLDIDATAGNEVPMQQLADGVYMLRVSGDQVSVNTKIVKQH